MVTLSLPILSPQIHHNSHPFSSYTVTSNPPQLSPFLFIYCHLKSTTTVTLSLPILSPLIHHNCQPFSSFLSPLIHHNCHPFSSYTVTSNPPQLPPFLFLYCHPSSLRESNVHATHCHFFFSLALPIYQFFHPYDTFN